MNDAVFIVIERFDGKKSFPQEYTLTRADVHNKTVLSTLIFIKEHLDPTLNFTAACRMAICGACGVRLNGQPIIACDTSMEDQLALYGTNRVTIAPLANFKVISDLVVDWEPALENLRKVHPSLVARKEFSKAKGCKQSADDMEKIVDMWDCVLCGCCASSCNKLAVNRADYLEPFVFNIAARMSVDSRSKDPMVHAKPAYDNGLWKCVHCQECANVCPKHIKPVEGISMMRNITVNRGLNQGKGPEHAEAFLTDMRDTGRLNEMKMALRTEGVTAMTRVGLAVNLLRHGKVHPTELLGNDPIKGQADFVRILDLAKADAKGKE